MARGMRPQTFHGAVALALTLALTVGLLFLFRVRMSLDHWYVLLGCWLVAINVVTFGYYAFDKARSKVSRSRVPEVVLHGLALAGGTLGAYLGMLQFRHKTIKGPFRIVFWLIAVLQVLLVVAVVYRLWKSGT
jgi:uncharacterized membrane protein YsdA (DUF1294 family)